MLAKNQLETHKLTCFVLAVAPENSLQTVDAAAVVTTESNRIITPGTEGKHNSLQTPNESDGHFHEANDIHTRKSPQLLLLFWCIFLYHQILLAANCI